MIISYGMSIVGSSHVKKKAPCQDSHRYITLPNGWVVAAIADGVGSAKHSEVASKMACDTIIDIFVDRINKESTLEDALKLLKEAYYAVDKAIKEHVSSNNELITDYDTTLDTVVFDGKKMIFGHSGDGGIVALTYEGDYLKVTTSQKAEDGICVIPIRAGDQYWEFGTVEQDVASVLMATDGVYDNFMPYLLREQPVEFYVPLIRWFMDNNVFAISEENRTEIEDSRKNFLCGKSCESITDDKTILVIVNSDIMPKLKDDSFYAEPDWAKLQDIWNRKAYPHLYKKTDTIAPESEVSNYSETDVSVINESLGDSSENSPSLQVDVAIDKSKNNDGDISNNLSSGVSNEVDLPSENGDSSEKTEETNERKKGFLGFFKRKKLK